MAGREVEIDYTPDFQGFKERGAYIEEVYYRSFKVGSPITVVAGVERWGLNSAVVRKYRAAAVKRFVDEGGDPRVAQDFWDFRGEVRRVLSHKELRDPNLAPKKGGREAKPVTIDGTTYASVSEASRILGWTRKTVARRVGCSSSYI